MRQQRKTKQPIIKRKVKGEMPHWLKVMLLWVMALILIGVILEMMFLFPNPEPDAPGGWIPTTPGSAYCSATGIPGIPNGTIRGCPTPKH